MSVPVSAFAARAKASWARHLGRWVPEPAERAPPAGAPHWPANAVIPLSYHPLPDIV
jgi:hypothetical protein